MTPFLLLIAASSSKNKKKHSRYLKLFHKSLSLSERRIRSRKIPRIALYSPKDCAWRKLWNSNDDQSLITLTGLLFQAFKALEKKFTPLFDTHSPHSTDGMVKLLDDKRSRKRIVTDWDCLGLVLAWTRTRGSLYVLQILFGMTRTSLDIYLTFSKYILLKILQEYDLS